jgi:hypothetical protein
MTHRTQPKTPPTTTVAFVRLIFLKDVRRTRLLLLLMLGVAALLVIQARPKQWSDVSLLENLLLVLGALLTGQVIVNDPAGRDFRFLFTRPVPGSAVFIAKSLFLTAFIVLPAGIIHQLVVARVGVPLLPPDHELMFLETAISTSYKLGLVVLPCIFFRMHLREIATAVVLGGMATLVNLFVLIPQRTAMQAWGNETKIWLGGFSDLLFEFLIVVVVFVTAIIRYRTKRHWLPLGVAATGMVLSLVLWLLLTTNSSLYLEFKLKDQLTAEQLNQIGITLPEVTQGPRWNQHWNLEMNGSHSLMRVLTVEGVQAPYYAFATGSHTVATFRSGKTLISDSTDFKDPPFHDPVDISIPDFQMATVTNAAPKIERKRQLEVQLLNYLPASLQNEDLTGVRLQGTITVRICRAYLAGSMPLKTGQALLAPRHRYTITDTYFSKNRVQFSYERLQVPLILRGEQMYVSLSDMNQNILVVYRPFNEALFGSSGGSGGGINNDFVKDMLFTATFDTLAVDHDPNWKPLPPDWASGAELVFVDSAPCGEITLPYKIENVDLH